MLSEDCLRVMVMHGSVFGVRIHSFTAPEEGRRKKLGHGNKVGWGLLVLLQMLAGGVAWCGDLPSFRRCSHPAKRKLQAGSHFRVSRIKF